LILILAAEQLDLGISYLQYRDKDNLLEGNMNKPITALIIYALAVMITSCSTIKTVQVGQGEPWEKPYVDGMTGAENLAFDGKGNMFVTTLDGYVYRVEPTDDPFRGMIADKIKVGNRCLDIEVTPEDYLLVAVQTKKSFGRVARLTKDFTAIEFMTGEIPGINGMVLDLKGSLYIASSNVSIINPKGWILKMDLDDDSTWASPPVFIETSCITNGLSLSQDESKLYYTCLNSSVNEVDLKTKEHITILSQGRFQFFDDLDASSPGMIWFCYNSQYALIEVKDGVIINAYRVGDLKAPSSCKFGKGPGFNSGFLYITEFGMKGRSLKADGRGVFVLPVTELKR
jgi:sugar lactone lactonase YvrE